MLNLRLYSSISGAKVSSKFQTKVGLIKGNEDPELTTIELPNGQQLTLSLDFIEWFRGFTDAEGCFLYSRSRYRCFRFSIGLHIDDVAPLEYIKNTLQIGRVSISPKWNMVTLTIVSRKEIEIILAIFSKYSLNSTKHLNFLAFKQAFTIYTENNSKEARDRVQPVLDSIRDSMNKLRTDFSMPKDSQVLVTEGWLLGFIEGDGSFHYSISKEMFTFSLGQKR